MLTVSLNLAVLAAMLFGIFAQGNKIELDVLNDPTPQPILEAVPT